MNFADLIQLQDHNDVAIIPANDLDTSLFAAPIYYQIVVTYEDQIEKYYVLTLASQTKALDLLKDEIIFNTSGSIAFGYQGQREFCSFDSKLSEGIFHKVEHFVLSLADYPMELLFPHLANKRTKAEIIPFRLV